MGDCVIIERGNVIERNWVCNLYFFSIPFKQRAILYWWVILIHASIFIALKLTEYSSKETILKSFPSFSYVLHWLTFFLTLKILSGMTQKYA